MSKALLCLTQLESYFYHAKECEWMEMNGQLNFQVTVVGGNRILMPTDTRTEVAQDWLRPVLERKIFTLPEIEPQLPNEYIQLLH